MSLITRACDAGGCVFAALALPWFGEAMWCGLARRGGVWCVRVSRPQRNKATERHIGLLKAKLAKLRTELVMPSKVTRRVAFVPRGGVMCAPTLCRGCCAGGRRSVRRLRRLKGMLLCSLLTDTCGLVSPCADGACDWRR